MSEPRYSKGQRVYHNIHKFATVLYTYGQAYGYRAPHHNRSYAIKRDDLGFIAWIDESELIPANLTKLEKVIYGIE